MPFIGKIGEFIEGKENFANYVERLEQFFAANGVKDEQKVPVFLSVIGPDAYALLKNLTSPTLPKEKDYDTLVETLKSHYMPKPLVISERFKFNRRHQKEGESVAAYVVELKRLATHCEFGTFLNEALRDRLVCGLLSENIQKRLLSKADLSLDEAIKIAVAMETADKETVSFSSSVKEVSYVRDKKRKPISSQTHSKLSTNRFKPDLCYRCGEAHSPDKCKFKESKCFKCDRKGHIAKKCRSVRRAHYIEEEEDLCENVEEDLGIYSVYMNEAKGSANEKYKVTLGIGGSNISMQVDTGSACTIINEETYKTRLSKYPLHKPTVSLRSYSGDSIKVLGEIHVAVNYEGQCDENMKLIVTAGVKPNLLGRDWLSKIKLNWKHVFQVVVGDPTAIRAKYAHLFGKTEEPIRGFKASIRLKEEAQPIFHKARPVPFALKDKVTDSLRKWEASGVIEKVERSEWASPLVVVPKADKSLRLCGDFKVTVNKVISDQQYPLPTMEDMFATLAGGDKFTKLDLSQAYTQLELDDRSQDYLVINTHLGLFKFKRLAYGVSSAPACFQSVMDQVLQGMPGVVCRIDDILITAPDDATHLERVEEVLRRLDEHNMRLREDKCVFMAEKVVFMGHEVDREGVHTDPSKVEAVLKAATPKNVAELRSYIGLINYYRNFLPNLSSTLNPLHELLKKDNKWSWTRECEGAFEKSKQMLADSDVLVHYDNRKEIRLACDASSYGLGAVISHVLPNGQEAPIAFASRTLTDAERNYSQLEKEALGIIFGVKKFHKFLYGRKFTLFTDHQALTMIFGPKKGIPTLAAARIQRWAVILSAYDYEIQYRRSEDHSNCDGLSRLPMEGWEKEVNQVEDMVSYLNELPVDSSEIAEATRLHPILSKVYDYTLNGWPHHVQDDKLKPYFNRRTELSVDQGVVLWGLRVIIPPKHQGQLLSELHDEHLGMCRMKALARGYIWWPGIDSEIETIVKSCDVCQSMRNAPMEAPLHPWKWATRPMERVHIDYADFKGQSFLLLVDGYSKWIEVIPMKSTTSVMTVEKLRLLFASTGIPEEIVSDNGPQFTSHEFKTFMNMNGIRHTLIPPYHAASNGLAERGVQVLKRALKSYVIEGKRSIRTRSLQHQLADFLLKYRVTPHSTTGKTPSELFLKRQLRNRLSLLKPDLEKKIVKKQQKMVENHDKHSVRELYLEKGDAVSVKNNLTIGKWEWIPGIIHQKLGSRTYLVKVANKIRYCHIDHLLRRTAGMANSVETPDMGVELPEIHIGDSACAHPRNTMDNPPEMPKQVEGGKSNSIIKEQQQHSGQLHGATRAPASPGTQQAERRYPTRIRKPPQKLNL